MPFIRTLTRDESSYIWRCQALNTIEMMLRRYPASVPDHQELILLVNSIFENFDDSFVPKMKNLRVRKRDAFDGLSWHKLCRTNVHEVRVFQSLI